MDLEPQGRIPQSPCPRYAVQLLSCELMRSYKHASCKLRTSRRAVIPSPSEDLLSTTPAKCPGVLESMDVGHGAEVESKT